MKLHYRIGSKRRHKQMQRNFSYALCFPVVGAIALLQSAKDDPGINIAGAFRAEEAAWSLYSHLHDRITPRQREEFKLVVRKLDKLLKDFDGPNARHDGWTEAMIFINTHEC